MTTKNLEERLTTFNLDLGGSFNKAINLIKGNAKYDLMITYNFFRLIDAFEDARNLPKKNKEFILNEIKGFIESKFNPYFIIRHSKIANKYTKFNSPDRLALEYSHKILKDFNEITIDDEKKEALSTHIKDMIDIMIKYLPEDNEEYRKTMNFDSFNEYCYGVGGKTGSLITEIFYLNNKIDKNTYIKLTEKKKRLTDNIDISLSESSGIFLQYVNMIKDAKQDFNDKKHIIPLKDSKQLTKKDINITIAKSLGFFKDSIEYLSDIKQKDIRRFTSLSLSKYSRRLEDYSKNSLLITHPNTFYYTNEDLKKEKQELRIIYLLEGLYLRKMTEYFFSKRFNSIQNGLTLI